MLNFERSLLQRPLNFLMDKNELENSLKCKFPGQFDSPGVEPRNLHNLTSSPAACRTHRELHTLRNTHGVP